MPQTGLRWPPARRPRWRGTMLALAALAATVAAMPAPGAAQAPGEATARLAAATAIQAATRARLRVLGDAFTCTDARFVSFRRSDAEPEISDQWYVASQLWADVVLLSLGAGGTAAAQALLVGWDPRETRCHVDKGFVFLDRLWDYQSAGYFPRSDPVGMRVESAMRFGDDNALAGLALLDAAAATPDAATAQRYVHAARREADFLVGSGLWDGTFGGGFWWNTQRGDTPEGKPAQTNALAALFFARLYEATHDPVDRDWALRTILWLDTLLYDPARHLYRWSVAFPDPGHRGGAPTISGRYFSYDQGIAIEAQLRAARLDADPGRLGRAREVGRALQATFWSDELGGYNLEAGIEQVYATYAAWTSLGQLALYDLDQDPRWLDLARANVDHLAARLGEPDGSVALRAYRCVDRAARGCQDGQARVVVDHTRDTAAQAWVQHAQVALAERVGAAAPPPATPDGDD